MSKTDPDIETRMKVFNRDHGRCFICGQFLSAYAFQPAPQAYALPRLGRTKPTQQSYYRVWVGDYGMPRTHPRPPQGIIRKRMAGQRLQRSPRERSSVQRIPRSRLPLEQLKKKNSPAPVVKTSVGLVHSVITPSLERSNPSLSLGGASVDAGHASSCHPCG